MKLQLNLNTAPRENKRPFLAGAAAIGTVAFLAMLVLSHAAYKSWRANRELRVQEAQLERDIRGEQAKQQALESAFQTPQAQQILDRAGFLNSLIGQRSFPWNKIFTDLEQTLPPGVRIVTISPKLQSGRALLTLSVGASSDDAKVKFLEALEKAKMFSAVEVRSERRETVAGQDRVTVELTVWYETT
jgi:Tfp pilus assembly protein PilN